MMIPGSDKIKTIALMSSGLDSLLAAKVVKDMGIDVVGVCFYFQFDSLAEMVHSGEVEELVRPLGIPLQCIDISQEFLPIFLNPQHGYGSGVNPCIDCHLFMLRKAAEMMEDIHAQFIVTGEVVGQRPMSQNKPTLFRIEKLSGLRGRILRPLSAKLLPATLPEEKGWVDREKLYDFSGRSRTPQMALASRLGITRYVQPAGGCILTEPGFSDRARALLAHREKTEITVQEIKLLRHGRHFWPKDHLHVVVGRDKDDNTAIEAFKEGRWVFRAADTRKSPIVLAKGITDESDIQICARITARYIGGDKSDTFNIHYKGEGREGNMTISPLSESLLEQWRV